MHHLICDVWSIGVFFRNTMALYDAFTAGALSPLPPLPVQYADYARWQLRRLTGAGLEELLGYWQAELEGAPQVTKFPDRDPGDGSTVERSSWSAPGKRSVALYAIQGGGHSVPHPAMHGWRLLGNSNRDIHAANEIWEFFQSVP